MPDDRHLIEHKTGSTELFKGRLLHAFRDTVSTSSIPAPWW
jgi:hypothetical protein